MDRNRIKQSVLAGLLTLSLSGCAGSCSNAWNDIKRDVSKRDYDITLYDTNGGVIFHDEPKDTFINVSENGSGLRYVVDGKLIMINGTYVLKEK